MSYSYKDLREIDDDTLVEMHDKIAVNTSVGVNYYLGELARRDSDKVSNSMLKCTKWITIMTAIMLIATIVNVAVAVIQ